MNVSLHRSGMKTMLLLAALAMPGRVRAQITLIKSEPSDGVQLVQAPTALKFWFSEAPAGKYTHFKLTDSTGYFFYLSPPKNFDNDERQVLVPIAGRLTPGFYHLEWQSVGADSTPQGGKSSFRVLTAEQAKSSGLDTAFIAPTDNKPPPIRLDEDNGSAATTVYSIARALSYTTLIMLIGGVIFRFLVVVRTRTRGGKSSDDEIEHMLAWRACVAGAVFLFVAIIRLFLQHRIMVAGLQGNTAGLHLGFMGLSTKWGTVWMMQCGFVFVSMIAYVLAHYRLPGAWILNAFTCVGLVFVCPVAGHAGVTDGAVVASVMFEAFHLAGVAGWLGSLFWLSVAAFPVLRQSGEARARRVADIVRAFTPVAIGSAALLAVSGFVSAWLRLGALPALWTTPYGIALIVKLVAVLAIAGLSDYDWQKALAALGRRGASASLARTVKLELIVSVSVILATAVLAGLPSPSR